MGVLRLDLPVALERDFVALDPERQRFIRLNLTAHLSHLLGRMARGSASMELTRIATQADSLLETSPLTETALNEWVEACKEDNTGSS